VQTNQTENITKLLEDWQTGDANAFKQLSEILHSEMHRLATHYMHRERSNHTLQATALVNEAYLRLVDVDIGFANKHHFMSVAGRTLRRILVDYARTANCEKRGRDKSMITLDEAKLSSAAEQSDILELNDAIDMLSLLDSRKAQVVELNFFAGLSAEELAPVLNISSRTAERDLKFAKAWLFSELSR
jgi:RNA polymerase sigma factor (TIGR02999 family)